MTSSRPLAFRWFLAFALLFSLQIVPRFWADSLVNDEDTEVTDGYFYLTRGDVNRHVNHGPFSMAWRALPLLPFHLDGRAFDQADQENRAYQFYFVSNQDRLDVLTVAPRAMVLLLGLALGFLLFHMTREAPSRCVSALALWAFEPTLLAHSGVAKNDLMTAFFLFACLYATQAALNRNRRIPYLLAGVLLGAAVSTKWSNLLAFPILAAFLIARVRSIHMRHAGWFWMPMGFLLWVGVLYLPGTATLPAHPDPWTLFVRGFLQALDFSRGGYPAFFMGQVSSDPRTAYFPAAFVLKTTIPFLLLLLLATGLALAGRLRIPFLEWITPLVVFLSVIRLQNLGIRYLLPAFPFLILIAARAAEWLMEPGRGRVLRGTAGLLLVWHAVSSLGNYPHHLSYFNDLVPRESKAHLLADSNLDWGQDHKRLVKTVRERGWKRVKLAYLGGVDPYFYGLDWKPWTRKDLDGPQAGYTYVINVSFLQMAPAFFPETLPIARCWISHTKPTGRVADSWYYFETPDEVPHPDGTPPLPSVPYFRYVQGVSKSTP